MGCKDPLASEYLLLTPHLWAYWCMPLCLTSFMWVLGIWTQVLMLVWRFWLTKPAVPKTKSLRRGQWIRQCYPISQMGSQGLFLGRQSQECGCWVRQQRSRLMGVWREYLPSLESAFFWLPTHPWTTEVIFLRNYSFYLCVWLFCHMSACLGPVEIRRKLWIIQNSSEFLVNMSYHMGAGNRTLVFWKKQEMILSAKSSL